MRINNNVSVDLFVCIYKAMYKIKVGKEHEMKMCNTSTPNNLNVSNATFSSVSQKGQKSEFNSTE